MNTFEELKSKYEEPLLQLILEAANTHKENWDPLQIQCSALVSIKTGGCTENCSYCSQSIHAVSKIKTEKNLDVAYVREEARTARERGANRLCLGAAWRELRDNKELERITEIIGTVRDENMEVCCTLGMLTAEQAVKLKQAGLTAYNHNLDTSRSYYPNIVSTRTYDERLNTLKNARNAGLQLCSGGIIGMGESPEDRLKMLMTYQEMKTPPESIPINLLIPMPGTALENRQVPEPHELIRLIAITRLLFPKSYVRLSAGRETLSQEAQALCFLAGANSIFLGDKLLTSQNASRERDEKLFKDYGLISMGTRN